MVRCDPSNCFLCGGDHELRKDPLLGLFLCACKSCRYFTPSFPSEVTALSSWDHINSVEKPCLGCGGQPRLRFSSVRKMWAYECSKCCWRTHLNCSESGACSAWYLMNTVGSSHRVELWRERAVELQLPGYLS
jgi:hypothetical protein